MSILNCIPSEPLSSHVGSMSHSCGQTLSGRGAAGWVGNIDFSNSLGLGS